MRKNHTSVEMGYKLKELFCAKVRTFKDCLGGSQTLGFLGIPSTGIEIPKEVGHLHTLNLKCEPNTPANNERRILFVKNCGAPLQNQFT